MIPFILVFDQISKKLAQEYLTGKTINLIGDFLTLSYVTNTGIAFGMFQGHPFIMGILATIVVTLIYVYRNVHLKKHKSLLFDLSTVFIIGGALGNIYDRIRIEYVVDMFSVKYFSVFNIADSFVTIGGILLGIYYLKRSNDPWKRIF
ncbi:signal peptidase II [Marinitoga arctica]